MDATLVESDLRSNPLKGQRFSEQRSQLEYGVRWRHIIPVVLHCFAILSRGKEMALSWACLAQCYANIDHVSAIANSA